VQHAELLPALLGFTIFGQPQSVAPAKVKTPAGGGRGFREDEQGENSIVQEISNSISE
jgi:hypothetical protein